MVNEIDVLKKVCFRLDQADIPYMLTGSFAANFYAVPRMTRDIDIVVQILKEDINYFHRIFQKDFYIDKDAIHEAIDYQNLFNIIDNESVYKIDFIIRKKSIYRQLEFQRRRKVDFENIPLWIVSPEDLIISKLSWAEESLSEMQFRDIKNILSSLKNLDKEYLEKWIAHLNLKHIYAKVVV